MLIECGTKSSTEGSNPSLSAIRIRDRIGEPPTAIGEDRGLKQRTLAPWTIAGLILLAGCSAKEPVPSGARNQGQDVGPAYFTQATAYGYRYAHNWVERPCFTIDLPGPDWVLQSATAVSSGEPNLIYLIHLSAPSPALSRRSPTTRYIVGSQQIHASDRRQ